MLLLQAEGEREEHFRLLDAQPAQEKHVQVEVKRRGLIGIWQLVRGCSRQDYAQQLVKHARS